MTNNIKSKSRIKLAVTIGDPAGIGPEVTLKALNDPEVFNTADWVILGDRIVIDRVTHDLGLSLLADTVTDLTESTFQGAQHAVVLDSHAIQGHTWEPGRLSAECGAASIEYIRQATRLCLKGSADAMVTGPVNKEAIALTHPDFTGHTDYISDLCGSTSPKMLLLNNSLRVLHVSTHCSLRQATMVSTDEVIHTIELGDQALCRLGEKRRRIAVCGLNPHAGEHGLFGREDEDTIYPAVVFSKNKGIDCIGPIPADTVFLDAIRGKYDLVVAMYHDQGHIPIKLIDFENTVNVSLGMSIIRTSVDHGTAFDIAGTGKANASSMKRAMMMAATLACEGTISIE